MLALSESHKREQGLEWSLEEEEAEQETGGKEKWYLQKDCTIVKQIMLMTRRGKTESNNKLWHKEVKTLEKSLRKWAPTQWEGVFVKNNSYILGRTTVCVYVYVYVYIKCIYVYIKRLHHSSSYSFLKHYH